MNIICYSDLTESAYRAVTVATELATRTKDTVFLVHPEDKTGMRKASDTEENERLREEIDRISSQGVLVKTMPQGHSLDRTIDDVALPTWTRLVVVAAPAKAGSALWQRGGIAEKIAEHSLVPTLAVRHAEPLLAWVRQERALRILCAYDFTATGDAALRYLKTFQRLGPCDMIVAHVGRLSEERSRLGIRTPMSLEGHEPEVQRILEREMREKVEVIHGPDAPIRICVEGTWGRPDFDLIDIANREKADLIIIGTHQWQGVDRLLNLSVSRFVLRHASENVLVVPRSAGAEECQLEESHCVLEALD
ncbi:MAG: universal stress protein [Opitutaceae bacterium]